MDSWFDLWHHHPNNISRNTTLEKRVETLLDLFKYFKLKLREYPHPYQLWMLICENDSSEDAIYIHTNNPNATPFPLRFNLSEISKVDCDIKDFVVRNDFIVAESFQESYKYLYVYEKGTGEPLL